MQPHAKEYTSMIDLLSSDLYMQSTLPPIHRQIRAPRNGCSKPRAGKHVDEESGYCKRRGRDHSFSADSHLRRRGEVARRGMQRRDRGRARDRSGADGATKSTTITRASASPIGRRQPRERRRRQMAAPARKRVPARACQGTCSSPDARLSISCARGGVADIRAARGDPSSVGPAGCAVVLSSRDGCDI
jgi:hypothetical protein